MDELYDTETLDIDEARDLPCHTGSFSTPTEAAHWSGDAQQTVQLIRGIGRPLVCIRSAEQRIALDLLLDPSIGIVSLGGRAGTGKSAPHPAGLEAVMERQLHRKVMVFRLLYAVGGQDLGFRRQ